MRRNGSKLIKGLMFFMLAMVLVGVGVLVVSGIMRQKAVGRQVTADVIAGDVAEDVRERDAKFVAAGRIAGKIFADISNKVNASAATHDPASPPVKLLKIESPMFLKDKLRIRVGVNSEKVRSGYPSGKYRVPPLQPGAIGDALDRLKGALPVIDIAYHSSGLARDGFSISMDFIGYVNSQQISSNYTYNGNCSSSKITPECVFEGRTTKIATGDVVTNPVLACLRALCICGDNFDAIAESDVKVSFVGRVLPESKSVKDASVDVEISGIGDAESTRREDFMAGFLETSGWTPPAI